MLLSLSYFFAVANLTGGRYIGNGSIFATGAVEISPHTDARRNSFIAKNSKQIVNKIERINKKLTEIYV